jgi:sulfite reductase alpha subunit-like flavoprotein
LASLQDTPIRCSPGDSLGIVCGNPAGEVEALISRLGLKDVADRVYELAVDENTQNKRAKLPDFIPKRSTLREILLNVVDIRGVPKKVSN